MLVLKYYKTINHLQNWYNSNSSKYVIQHGSERTMVFEAVQKNPLKYLMYILFILSININV